MQEELHDLWIHLQIEFINEHLSTWSAVMSTENDAVDLIFIVDNFLAGGVHSKFEMALGCGLDQLSTSFRRSFISYEARVARKDRKGVHMDFRVKFLLFEQERVELFYQKVFFCIANIFLEHGVTCGVIFLQCHFLGCKRTIGRHC